MPWQSERRQSFRSCSGGLISYGPNFPDLWRCAGDYVDKILLGAKPDDIPVEQPTKFDLVINLTTAKGARAYATRRSSCSCRRDYSTRRRGFSPCSPVRLPLGRAQCSRKPPQSSIALALLMIPIWNAFREGLREHGYFEDQSVAFEYRYAGGLPDRPATATRWCIEASTTWQSAPSPGSPPARRGRSDHSDYTEYPIDSGHLS